MAKRNEARPIVKLRSSAGTGFTYVTRKNRRSHPDRLVLRKYDPRVRRLSRGTLMAKKSKIVANQRRKQVVARYAERRAALKETLRTAETAEQHDAAVRALSRLPRDASPVRVRNRDQIDGRPRGYFGKVGLSRTRLRDLAHRGQLPGITKSSW